MKKLNLLLTLLIIGSGTLQAEISLYGGADVYYARASGGLASERTVRISDTTVLNYPETTRNFMMVGGNLSLVFNRIWFFSYTGSYGFLPDNPETTTNSTTAVTFAGGRVDILGTSTGPDKSTRFDQNIALTRILGKTGFSIFVGGKWLQSQNKVDAGGQSTKTTTIFAVSTTVETTQKTSTGKSSGRAFGPSVGFSFNYLLAPRYYLSLQLSYLLLFSEIGFTIKEADSASANTTTIDESYYGNGGTALVSIIRTLGSNVFIYLSFRAQMQYLDSKSSKFKSVQDSDGSILADNSNFSFVDGTTDVFLGANLGVMAKVF